MNEHERLQESIAADALGAADREGEDDRALLDHLVECDECRDLYRQFRETAGDLALTAGPAEISPGFERRVLAVTAERARPRSKRAARRSRWLVAAALVGVAVLGGSTIRFASQLSDERARTNAVLAILNDPSARTAVMRGEGPGPMPEVAVTVTDDGRGLVQGSRLVLPKGVFALWLIRDGSPELGAVLRPAPDGTAIALFDTRSAPQAVAVTVEDGPVDQPTTDPILSGELT